MKNSLPKIIIIVLYIIAQQSVYSVSPERIPFKIKRDSIFRLLDRATACNYNGNFIKGEELINKAWNSYKAITNKNCSFDLLKFDIQNAKAWNKTLLKKYSQAESIYKTIIAETPDSFHLYLSQAYTGIASLYGMQKMYDYSEKYSILSLNHANIANNNEAIFHAQSNLGDIYIETKKYQKALEKYLEVKRLSVVLGKNEAISSSNLAIAYYKLGKAGLAEQYYEESLALSKESSPVVYSITLSYYCELLIDMGKTEKAKQLILDAIKDSRYTQMDEYNLKFLNILSKLYPKYSFSQTTIMLTGLFIILVILLLIWLLRKQTILTKAANEKSKQLIQLAENIEKTCGITHESTEISLSHENTLQIIGILESLPDIFDFLHKIKIKSGNKSEVLSSVRGLEAILSPLGSDNIKKELSHYIERSNCDFYNKLKKFHPELSLTDMRMCTLIKLGLGTKEIAMTTNKSVRGVESAKFRLRKKMSLDTFKDIYDYLLEIDKALTD